MQTLKKNFLEIKRHKNKPDQQFQCELLHREQGYAVLRYTSGKPGLISDIRDVLDDIGLDASEFPAPEPEQAEPYSKPLFLTTRDYLAQLDVYSAYDDGQL